MARSDRCSPASAVAERTIFVIMSGPSVRGHAFDRPPAIVDIAVTALAHLGVAVDPAWGLDGRSLLPPRSP